VVLIVRSIFWSGSTTSTPKGSATAAVTPPAPRVPTLGLIASNPVQVTVRKKNPDESEGEIVFTGMLNAGESRSVPRSGPLFIEASAAENLQIEVDGKRHNLGRLIGNGYQRGQLPGP
jgi:hypothetical protein